MFCVNPLVSTQNITKNVVTLRHEQDRIERIGQTVGCDYLLLERLAHFLLRLVKYGV